MHVVKDIYLLSSLTENQLDKTKRAIGQNYSLRNKQNFEEIKCM